MLVAERSRSGKATHTLCDSNYRTFWRQNYGAKRRSVGGMGCVCVCVGGRGGQRSAGDVRAMKLHCMTLHWWGHVTRQLSNTKSDPDVNCGLGAMVTCPCTVTDAPLWGGVLMMGRLRTCGGRGGANSLYLLFNLVLNPKLFFKKVYSCKKHTGNLLGKNSSNYLLMNVGSRANSSSFFSGFLFLISSSVRSFIHPFTHCSRPVSPAMCRMKHAELSNPSWNETQGTNSTASTALHSSGR